MMYLVDSDWIIDYLKGQPATIAFLDNLATAGMALSIITYAEVYEGIHYGSDPALYARIFRDFLRVTRVIGISRPIARRFAVMRGALRAQGAKIPQPDLFIAATALHLNLILLTRNVKHFHRIPGLRLYSSL